MRATNGLASGRRAVYQAGACPRRMGFYFDIVGPGMLVYAVIRTTVRLLT